jgi:hypothetical protein
VANDKITGGDIDELTDEDIDLIIDRTRGLETSPGFITYFYYTVDPST